MFGGRYSEVLQISHFPLKVSPTIFNIISESCLQQLSLWLLTLILYFPHSFCLLISCLFIQSFICIRVTHGYHFILCLIVQHWVICLLTYILHSHQFQLCPIGSSLVGFFVLLTFCILWFFEHFLTFWYSLVPGSSHHIFSSTRFPRSPIAFFTGNI